MAKKQKKVKLNKRLLNAKMQKKFSLGFGPVIAGVSITAMIAMAGIILLCINMAKNGLPITLGIVVIVILLIVEMLTIILCKTVSTSLADSIVVPIFELKDAVNKLKAGDFDIDITYESCDELGELAQDLKDTCNQLKAVINDSGSLLSEMAEGNFNVTSSAADLYVGDFETLIVAMNQLNSQLDATLRQIKESAGHVMIGSEQLAGSAQELAEGASEQACAVDELTATIADVTNIAEDSARNAMGAADSAKEAADEASGSREKIGKLTEAMDRITETSKEIENIITAIEKIAAQTNLLSLNASIEAARAGEMGKGFAVVADQIGKLAADSRQSAVTTRELISKSLTEIENGSIMVEYTMESIGTALTNMESFAGAAAGAAQASQEQADMLKQIQARIDQISTVVQSNSASAEETSAISQELSAQAIGLEEMIGKFELRDGSGEAAYSEDSEV
ncbi:MAG: HAMP domain-containing protein [Lachnospiraceae bacterium]|nr:HAMP domain-containing protein [Lachnospiraceae bacterium]